MTITKAGVALLLALTLLAAGTFLGLCLVEYRRVCR